MSALFALVGAGHGISVIPGLSFPADWAKLVQRTPLQPRLVKPLWMLDVIRPRNDPSVTVLKTMISDAAARLGR
jgi:DNA-binding transcriptional LysR family regulator